MYKHMLSKINAVSKTVFGDNALFIFCDTEIAFDCSLFCFVTVHACRRAYHILMFEDIATGSLKVYVKVFYIVKTNCYMQCLLGKTKCI